MILAGDARKPLSANEKYFVIAGDVLMGDPLINDQMLLRGLILTLRGASY